MQTIGNNPCFPKIIANSFSYKYDDYGVWIGDNYVILPYFSYGNTEAKDHILLHKKWEFRGLEPISKFYTKEKVSCILYLKNSIEDQYNSFKSNVRRKINKAQKNEVNIKIGKEELLSDFYLVYVKSMHFLGSPALPFKFFNDILFHYENGYARIFIAYKNNIAIGSAFMLSYGDFYENTWFASLRKYNYLYTTYLLHWEMIKFSIENKAKIYSFGRSTQHSSVHHYKKQWNTEDIQLYWSYSENKKFTIKKMKILSKLWKRMPSVIIRLFGPYLAKKIY